MSVVGINVGALTVKVVQLDGLRLQARVVAHRGQPAEVLEEVLRAWPGGEFFGVSGRLGSISEVAATEAALAYVGGHFDAVASVGGEAFTVYLLDGSRIVSAESDSRCAAGSGEFLVQQFRRLGLSIDEAVERSFQGRVVPLASRCGVYCKSDITHKLNRHEARIEDILCSLHDIAADKVASLLDRARHRVRRLLLVGGVSQNRALRAALDAKVGPAEIVVLPQSPYFEALGAAVLTRDNPVYDRPHLTAKPTLGVLPALGPYERHVTRVRPPVPSPARGGTLVLGVDAGSTTTKTVLVRASTCEPVAWHYGQTRGDPVAATRRGLQALIDQVGTCSVGVSAATGSARELIGAWLGTAHVYNEISAHATGAAAVDPRVDTIFEIGGQDAKYVYLRNGVPVDYAMNASCSAGTGSFLVECAEGDLGLALEEIADAARRATRPVHFKATCAAFINSDIRTALQEGRSRGDVAAGLVHAVVRNYLHKVKGRRPVGQKVFLQGGVALNEAVGCAFAQCLGKGVTVPPHPELQGAIGVALLALVRGPPVTGDGVALADLAAATMTGRGQFTCRGCGNLCTIDRMEVAGRQFPFGGRCSRYENVWKGTGPAREAEDLVAERNRLVLTPPAAPAPGGPDRGPLGIPRALTTHSLYPLYATFLAQVGFEPVLSRVAGGGGLKAYSSFCFPVQTAHGAVLDLVHRGIRRIFLPHVIRMPNPTVGRDSYLCPITQASPYVLAKAFPEATIHSPVLNFARGYEACDELVHLAVSQWGVGSAEAQRAYAEAIRAQRRTEQALQSLGRRALREALADGEPTILLVGRSYNAYPPEASQSVARKLASMGVRVIPADCLPPARPGPTAWHFPNVILNAVSLAKQHTNLFLLYLSNFSCTIDAFIVSRLASELGSRPYLVLEIDAHTADAGIQTRLEAFLDILSAYSDRPASPPRTFQAATIGPDAVVTASDGRRAALDDPRVRIYFPAFSHYHSRALTLAATWLGLHPGPAIDLSLQQAERGLPYTSGRECLPLPICVGQLLEACDRRQPGEIVGFYMVQGGAPCVVDCYLEYFERFIREHELPDVVLVSPEESNNYYGLGLRKMTWYLAPLLTLADLFVEMAQVLRVVGGSGAPERLRACWDRHIASQPSVKAMKAELKGLVDRIAAMPRRDPAQHPKVVITGDFFLRFHPAFLGGLHDLYAQHGIILVPVGLNELLLYGAYAGMAEPARDWGVPPGSVQAAALAAVHAFQPDGQDYLWNWAEFQGLKYYEKRYRRLFRRTGLLVGGANDVGALLRWASPHISPAIVGEAIPTVGKGVAAGDEGYDGIIAIGPFNCLPFRISQAILKPHSLQTGMPILTYESDGFSLPPAFLRQAEVHIQQVLSHRSGRP